jgi:cytochrome P450
MEDRIANVGSSSLVNYLNQNLINEDSKEIDLFKLFHYNTLDVISELIFGKNLNTTTDSQSAKYYFEGIEKTQKLLFIRLLVPFSNFIRLPMEYMFKPIILDNIQKRRSSSKTHHDILQSLIDARDPDSGEGLKDLEIVDECLVLLFAGMDTTANTMTWTLYEILKHPDIYKLVRDEILEKFPDLNKPISYDLARNKLEYFEACVLESMRKNPVGAAPMPRIVPEGGLTVNGYYLPPKVLN